MLFIPLLNDHPSADQRPYRQFELTPAERTLSVKLSKRFVGKFVLTVYIMSTANVSLLFVAVLQTQSGLFL